MSKGKGLFLFCAGKGNSKSQGAHACSNICNVELQMSQDFAILHYVPVRGIYKSRTGPRIANPKEHLLRHLGVCRTAKDKQDLQIPALRPVKGCANPPHCPRELQIPRSACC